VHPGEECKKNARQNVLLGEAGPITDNSAGVRTIFAEGEGEAAPCTRVFSSIQGM
jgi:hypothetical protein